MSPDRQILLDVQDLHIAFGDKEVVRGVEAGGLFAGVGQPDVRQLQW